MNPNLGSLRRLYERSGFRSRLEEKLEFHHAGVGTETKVTSKCKDTASVRACHLKTTQNLASNIFIMGSISQLGCATDLYQELLVSA